MTRPVSIVTVSYDTLFFIRLLVERVRAHIGSRDYEIIVVDRGSRDGTREWLEAQTDVVLLMEKAQRRHHGHGESAEAGAARAKFDHIVLLDSDAHPMEPNWLELTIDRLDDHHRLAGGIFRGLHSDNPHGWYIHPHFMAFHRSDLGGDVTLRKIRGSNLDTGEAATVRLLQAGRGVIGYPLEFCARFVVGHPHFPTIGAGVFHAWYGTRLRKDARTVGEETSGKVTAASYLEPLKERLRQRYHLDY